VGGLGVLGRQGCSTLLDGLLVPRLPTAVLATGLVLLSFLAFVCGLILHSVARGRKELKRLTYLAIPAPTLANERPALTSIPRQLEPRPAARE
jgi:hypothetical protein